jgi:hypothetical protein
MTAFGKLKKTQKMLVQKEKKESGKPPKIIFP